MKRAPFLACLVASLGALEFKQLGIGLAATLVVTTFVTRLAGKALRQQIGETPEAEVTP